MLELFLSGFLAILNIKTFVLIIIGVGVGIIFGAVPGLTAVMAIALFLPVTYSLTALEGLTVLVSLYIGAVSGGLISAILLKIPGTPASIATCFEGHPMAEKGESAKALGVGTVFSFLGTVLSITVLVFIAPVLAEIAIKFGPFEYFSIAVFSLTLIASLSGKSVVKGLMSAVFGFMLATVGISTVDGIARYTFGLKQFRSGFDILTVLVGLYAIAEVLTTASKKEELESAEVRKVDFKMYGFGFSMKEFWGQKFNLLRSAAIGIGIGILPGIGGGTSNILAYTVAKNQSKYPEKFGTGIIDGIVASETANNASIGGAMIPLLTLGIPGDAATAMLLGGFMIHGITPGPLLFSTNADVIYGVFAAMLMASIVMIILQFFGLKLFIKVLNIPKNYLLPVIIALCVVGAFGLNNRVFDVWAILIFGIIGFALSKFEYPIAPLILGFVLGGITELNLRRALMTSQGSIVPFFTNPISGVFLTAAILSIVWYIYKTIKVREKVNIKA